MKFKQANTYAFKCSNKACSWENFQKKNKKNSMLIRDFRVLSNYLKNLRVGKGNPKGFDETA